MKIGEGYIACLQMRRGQIGGGTATDNKIAHNQVSPYIVLRRAASARNIVSIHQLRQKSPYRYVY